MVFAAVVAAGAACSRASSEGEAKQWAEPPPTKDVPIPQHLEITVVVDGAAAAAITGDTLRGIKPDFADEERKAWRIATLISGALPAGTVEASSPSGLSVKFQHPTADGLEPVLYLTRRGDIIVAALDPKDPFPRYHGQGGRLHRAGDSLPRVAPVSKLEIRRSTP
ncbi:MAG: hypothetical protein H6Q90_1243 [Deltaproteobacteria bacterium]|nr:hypothetical protein [Deltaproteobacteria bacterium]